MSIYIPGSIALVSSGHGSFHDIVVNIMLDPINTMINTIVFKVLHCETAISKIK